MDNLDDFIKIITEFLKVLVGTENMKQYAECMKGHCGEKGLRMYAWYVDVHKLLVDFEKASGSKTKKVEKISVMLPRLELMMKTYTTSVYDKDAMECMIESCKNKFIAYSTNTAKYAEGMMKKHVMNKITKTNETVVVNEHMLEAAKKVIQKLKTMLETEDLKNLAKCVHKSCKNDALTLYIRRMEHALKTGDKLILKMSQNLSKQTQSIFKLQGFAELVTEVLEAVCDYLHSFTDKKLWDCMLSECKDEYIKHQLLALKRMSLNSS